jgi:hypothetical protein
VRCLNGGGRCGGAVVVEATLGGLARWWVWCGWIRVGSGLARMRWGLADATRGVLAGLSGADPLRHCGDEAF